MKRRQLYCNLLTAYLELIFRDICAAFEKTRHICFSSEVTCHTISLPCYSQKYYLKWQVRLLQRGQKTFHTTNKIISYKILCTYMYLIVVLILCNQQAKAKGLV